eukprot:jgi/Orpsp1_1/1186290/evm.model.d7180000049478.1
MGVYLDSIKHPDSLIYNVPYMVKLKENINIDKIKEGFNKLLENQEILKSKYIEKQINGKIEIIGVIDNNLKIEFEEYENSNMKEFVKPFNLSEGPLIRVGIVNNSLLMIDMHHIICDGTTISIIKKELNNYYENNTINELEVQFSDYALYIEDKKNNGLYEEQFKYYQKMFKENYDIITLPQKEEIKNKDKDYNMNKSNIISQMINKELSNESNKYVKTNNISKTSFFLSIYGYILSKYSGQDNVYTSIISANRNNHYTENMIGMFVSTQPVLLQYGDEDCNFAELIKNNMKKLIEIYNNQEISFSELVNKLKLEKVNNTFVFQAKGIIQENENNNIFDEEDENDIYTVIDNYSDDLIERNDKEAKFDITFTIAEKEENYLILIEYNEAIYENSLISHILDSYIEVIKNIETFENVTHDIEYISEEEKEKIINVINSNIYKYEFNKLYHVEFSKIAKSNGNKCVLVYNGENISYKQLDEMSNSLAHYLRNQNINREDIIPIICERSHYY